MAKIARRSVASNPSSLTSITIPPTNLIENNYITTHQQKRSTHSKSETNLQDSISSTTPLSYSSSLSESSASSSSESLETSSTLSLSLSPSLSPSPSITSLTDIEPTEKVQLTTLFKANTTETETIETEVTATTISASIDPLRSIGYQLTTRTISKNFDNINNISKQSHRHGTASIHPNTQKTSNHNIKNINNVSKISQNETTKPFTNIPTTSATPTFKVDKATVPVSTIPLSTAKSPAALAAERERVRMEFYATYDVMTGVRIAATLGGFFSLMVFLIVWKSRSHSNETIKALKDPKTAALTVACMQEEEDRKIIEAMDATGLSIFPDEYDTMLFRRQRMLSVGNVSAPPVLHRGFRFSSVGGYSSLLEPPRRFSISSTGGGISTARRRSASESSRILSNYPMGSSFGTDDYFVETDDELDEDYENLNQTEQKLLQNQGFLEVPPSVHQDTRRSSAMTCCSTESSYLERRCSALTLGINNLPPELRQKDESIKKARRGSSTDTWDYYYPDIQVIQATPKSSPLASDKDFEKGATFKQARTISQDTTTTAASGVSSITLDSSGSSWQKNSMICFYDPESLQERKLPSIDSEHSLDFCQSNTTEGEDDSSDKLEIQSRRLQKHQTRQPTIITTTSATPSPKTLTDKFDDMRDFKLRKLSDASSCINNNTSFTYYVSNNNNIFDHSGSCITPGITQPPSSTYSVSRAVRSNLRGVGTIGGTGIGRAPLASCSSFKMSSVECQDSDLRSSLGDDESVFIESYADTDDDLEQFSTDSDEISLEVIQAAQNDAIRYIDDNGLISTLPINNQRQPTSDSYNPNSFYEHQLSTKSAPPEILNGKKPEDYKKPVGKGAILKQNYQRTSTESHRTLSVSSSDKVLLVPRSKQVASYEQSVGKKFKTKSNVDSQHINAQYSNKRSSSKIEQHQNKQHLHQYQQQEELLLKPILSPGNTPLLAIRRSQLQQQYSDPSHSLPTTDETVTLETCSTEIPVVTTIVTTNLTGTSTTTSVFSPTATHLGIQIPANRKYYDQHKQKPPIIIKKQSSFSYDNNNDSSISSNSNSNSINKNLNKKRLSSSKHTHKKIKIKNRTALSDSSIPPYPPQSTNVKPSSTARASEILIPQTSQTIESTRKISNDDLLINTIKTQPIDCRQTDFLSENVILPYGSQYHGDPFHTTVSYSTSDNSKHIIDDRGISLVDSLNQQQRNQFVEKYSSRNLLKNSDNFSNYSSTNIPILNPSTDRNVDDINKKQIVDVSIVIEGVESEESSTNNVNNVKTNIITNKSKKLLDNSKNITSTSVMLELPVIKVPTDIEDDDSVSSNSRSVDDINEFNNKVGRVRSKSERCDPPIRDPSLPGTSRKWSKETLF
ncbi:serine-rich adhesin for platelets [Condylostylus longicornis]|uniref:serine-rich adhesin for platelets n=1 Tax=Condylostylus longicornis TaxID=2530218 RepID=UPI00244E584C|nr:serine-rich adhesin for platelets [Condylostylus longicornis]